MITIFLCVDVALRTASILKNYELFYLLNALQVAKNIDLLGFGWIPSPPASSPPHVKFGQRACLSIGYFSADFRDHPVSHQMAQVLATHDRSKIEVYAYSFKQANDAMQKQIISKS